MKKVMILVLLVALIFTGCSKKGQDQEKGQSQLDAIKEKGVIVMGTSADYQPYEFHITKDGKDTIVGADIEIGEAIAEALGVKLEIVDMDFDGLIPSLNADKVDMVIAGMSETPERAESVDFSVTYKKVDQTILIRKEDVDKYKSIEDFKGATMGAQKGSLQEGFLDDEMADNEKVALAKIPDLILALEGKKVEGVVLEDPIAANNAENNDKVALSGIKIVFDKGSAVVVKKGSKELLDAINPVVQKLVDEGQIEKWLDEYDAMDPGN